MDEGSWLTERFGANRRGRYGPSIAARRMVASTRKWIAIAALRSPDAIAMGAISRPKSAAPAPLHH